MASNISRSSSSSEEDYSIGKTLPNNVKIPDTKLGPEVIALYGKPRREASLYCGPLDARRRKEYKKDAQNRTEIKAVTKKASMTVLKEDAAKNSKILSVSVLVFGGLGSLGWIGGPIGGAAGTSIGIASGVAVGGAIIKHNINKKVNITISFSDHFASWRAMATAQKIYPIFRNFVDMDKEFEGFMCPITDDICAIPVVSPGGKTYEQSAIYAYIDGTRADPSVKIISPLRDEHFSKNELIINVKYCRDLNKKCSEIYRRILANGKQLEVQYGMHAVMQNTKEIMEGIRLQLAFQLYQQYDKEVHAGRMTREKRDQIIDESTKQWDFRDIH